MIGKPGPRFRLFTMDDDELTDIIIFANSELHVARNSSNALASAMVSAMATALPSLAFQRFLFSFVFSSGECPGKHRILPGERSTVAGKTEL